MKDTYKITNINPPLDEKDVVNKEYCYNSLLSSYNKKDILTKNITELRKGDNDKATTKRLQINKIQVNEELINGFVKRQTKLQILLIFVLNY